MYKCPGRRDEIHFGIKAGANYSNVYDVKGQDFTADYKFGFAGGIFVAVPLGNYLGFSPRFFSLRKDTNQMAVFLDKPIKSHILLIILISLFCCR